MNTIIPLTFFSLILSFNLNFVELKECNCIKTNMGLQYINEDTVLIDNNFLLFDNLTFTKNDSLDKLIKKMNVSLFNNEKYCYSNKLFLDKKYYLIQIISESGFTNHYLIGSTKNNLIELYTLSWSKGFDNRIYVGDFIEYLKGKEKVTNKLENRLREVTKWNQKRFPVFVK
jgi:hypothetical protein